jgi:hypothetical protein
LIAWRYKVVSDTQTPEAEVKHWSAATPVRMAAVATAFVITVATVLLETGYAEHLRRLVSSSSSGEVPVLRSINAQPIVVRQGDTLVVTVGMDRPAPKNGLAVVLSSSDPSVLPIKGQVPIDQGEVFGSVEFQVPYVPNYRSPIHIVASYNGATVSSAVSVGGPLRSADPAPRPVHTAATVQVGLRKSNTPATVPSAAAPTPGSSAGDAPPKPAPLNPELRSRLEDAQGRLTAELGFWETMKRQMPLGTSLRPEITSQIYAAKYASQRCSDDVKASDAASLGPCVDSLNDHLNQLKLQH